MLSTLFFNQMFVTYMRIVNMFNSFYVHNINFTYDTYENIKKLLFDKSSHDSFNLTKFSIYVFLICLIYSETRDLPPSCYMRMKMGFRQKRVTNPHGAHASPSSKESLFEFIPPYFMLFRALNLEPFYFLFLLIYFYNKF